MDPSMMDPGVMGQASPQAMGSMMPDQMKQQQMMAIVQALRARQQGQNPQQMLMPGVMQEMKGLGGY